MNEKDLTNFKLNTMIEIASELSVMYFSKISDSLIVFKDCLLNISDLFDILMYEGFVNR